MRDSVHRHVADRRRYIAGTNGYSNGIIPMLRVYNNTARYVDQGGNKRPGAFAIYLEPWHADVFEWLDLRKNHGKEEVRARDLFYALWIPDMFMRRVEVRRAVLRARADRDAVQRRLAALLPRRGARSGRLPRRRV